MVGGAQILLAVPETLLRRELAALLRAGGHDVTMTRGLPEAVRLARDGAMDVIMAVPDMTSTPRAEAFTDLCSASAAPVIALVMDAPKGPPVSETARLARSAGARDIVYGKSRPGVAQDLGPLLLRKVTALRLPSSRAISAPDRALGPRRMATGEGASGPATPAKPPASERFPIFLIGCSTGGPAALETVLSELPADFGGALVVAQHMRSDATRAFAARLARQVRLTVVEVDSSHVLAPGTCYIAAGGADVVLSRRQGRFTVTSVAADPREPFHPSVNRMVKSAAGAVPLARLRAVLLTGIGEDGADSMAQLHASGVTTLAESAESCLVFGMPARLIEKGGASHVLPIEKIAPMLMTLQSLPPRGGAPYRTHDARSRLAALAQRSSKP